jgi:hypothetical protein
MVFKKHLKKFHLIWTHFLAFGQKTCQFSTFWTFSKKHKLCYIFFGMIAIDVAL